VRGDMPGIDRHGALELAHRIAQLLAIQQKQPEVVVPLRARVVLFEKRAVLSERVVVIRDALIVEAEGEVVRRRWCRRGPGRS